MWNVSFLFKCREDKYVFPNLSNISSYISKNIEGEISRFPSSPLYDSSYHEDASVCNIELSNHECHANFIDSFDFDSHFSTVNVSKPLVIDDPSSGELEFPQVLDALSPELMVTSGSHSLEISSTSY